MKSGIGDVLIDEAVGTLPMPIIAEKVVAGVVKKQAHELTGTGLQSDVSVGTSVGMSNNDIHSNPYIPQALKGAGLQKYGLPIETHNDRSNIVHIHSDAFHPDYKLSNAYSNPVGHAYRTDMK